MLLVPCRVRVKLDEQSGRLYDLQVNNDFNPVLLESEDIACYVVVRSKGFPSSGDETYFANGSSRRFSLQIQFRLKQDWNGDELYLGAHLDRPFESLPTTVHLAVHLARLIDPGHSHRFIFTCTAHIQMV
jgi:hypothetical protein